MYLVTQGKGRVNQLGYTPKTQTYTYIHKGVVIWEMKGNSDLFDLFNQARAKREFVDMEECDKNPIYQKYSNSCHEFELEEWKQYNSFPKIVEVIK